MFPISISKRRVPLVVRSFHAKALLRGTLPFAFSHRTNILATALANQLHREYFVAVGDEERREKRYVLVPLG